MNTGSASEKPEVVERKHMEKTKFGGNNHF
jgi:hypothetical protein